MSIRISRHDYGYFVYQENTNARPASGGENWIIHQEGVAQLDKYYNRWDFVPKIGGKVIDWKYTPKNGYVNVKYHDIPLGQNIGETCRIRLDREIDCYITQTKDDNSSLKMTQPDKYYCTNRTEDDISTILCSHIDSFKTRDFAFGRTAPIKIIPSIHVGLLLILALNPGKATTDFTNAAAYWSVKCDIVFEVDKDSLYAHQSQVHATVDEVVMIEKKLNYTRDDHYILPLNFPIYGS